VAIGTFKLPKIEHAQHKVGEKVNDSIWRHPNLIFGAIAIFVYVGAEVSIGSFLVNYFAQPEIGGLTEKVAASFVAFYWGGAMVGRFIGSALLQKMKTGGLLGICAVCAAGLVAISMLTSGHFAMYSIILVGLFTRFAAVLVGSSGEGGAKLHRRNWGEAVENLTGTGEYHWMAGNFLKYGAAEATFGSKNAGSLPVDAHELIALCAPRLTFISYGVPEKGDARWLDHQGSYMAAVAAGPVFRLLGAKDLGTSSDYQKEKMPAVNTGFLDGQLAWRQHDGGHTDGPNWKYFIPWADKFFGRGGAAKTAGPG